MIYVILFYLLSLLGAYKYVQVSHSKGGQWEILTPGLFDLSMVLILGCNTMLAIYYLFGGATEKETNFSKFFSVKKQ